MGDKAVVVPYRCRLRSLDRSDGKAVRTGKWRCVRLRLLGLDCCVNHISMHMSSGVVKSHGVYAG